MLGREAIESLGFGSIRIRGSPWGSMVIADFGGLTRPGDGSLGWVAQKRGVCYAARFTSEASAAKWLAGQLGVSVSSLRWPGSDKHIVQESFRGVVYHSGCWEARLAGGVVAGYFSSQEEALRQVMRKTGMKKKQLRNKEFSKKMLRARFKCMHRIFGSYEPGDVRTLYAHESKSARIFLQAS
jgi:hypothetical protein